MLRRHRSRDGGRAAQFVARALGTTPEVARQALEEGELRSVPDGTVLFHEGEAPDARLAVIVDGFVEVVVRRDEGPRAVRMLGPGRLVGEIGALEGVARTAGAIARCDVVVLWLSVDRYRALTASHPEIDLRVRAEIAERRTQLTLVP